MTPTRLQAPRSHVIADALIYDAALVGAALALGHLTRRGLVGC